jgi:hypothetical protein
MNLMRTSPLFTVAALLFLAVAFSACETTTKNAYFAEASQSTTAIDLRSDASGRTGPAVEGTGRPEGVGRWAGHYWYIRNGEATRLFQKQRFAQGYWFDHQGHLIARDGSIVILSNGEMVTFAGEHLPIPPGVIFPPGVPWTTAKWRVGS